MLASLCRTSVLLILLAGCGVKQLAGEVALPPAPVPDYGAGDSYRFSDGGQESVIAVDRDVISWRDNDGTYVTSREILLPRLSWANGSVRGARQIAGTTSLLFPLERGKVVVFSAVRTVSPVNGGMPSTVREDWQCDVSETARVETKAGSFDTWRVDCSTIEQPDAPGTSVIQRSFYYAPEIGFSVRREERVGAGPVQRVDLTDYRTAGPMLPDSALRLRVARIQQTLERELSGDATSWRDPATGSGGDVLPLRTVRSSQYGWCRDFAERIQSAGRVYNMHGTGCRDLSGVWNIVALTPARNGSS